MSNENQKNEHQQDQQQPTTPTSVQPPPEPAVQELTDADLEAVTGAAEELWTHAAVIIC